MKKVLTFVMAIAIIATLAVATSAAESPTDYIAYFSFDNEESGFSGGGAVATPNNTAGADAAVVVDTDNAYIGGGAVLLDDMLTDPYCWLEVTKEDGTPLLNGLNDVTISFWSYTDGVGPNWAYFVVPNIDGVPYAQVYNTEKYIGCLLNAGITCERFLCNGARTYTATGVCYPEEWQMVTVTYTNESIALYQDGEWMTSLDACVDHNLPDILLDDSTFYIGTSTWGGIGSENFTGMLDEFYVYPYAMTDEQVADLYAAQVVDAPETDAPETDAPEAPETDAPETDAPETNAPATDAPSTDAPATDAPEEKGGCGSVMSGAAIAIVAITATLGCAVIKK